MKRLYAGQLIVRRQLLFQLICAVLILFSIFYTLSYIYVTYYMLKLDLATEHQSGKYLFSSQIEMHNDNENEFWRLRGSMEDSSSKRQMVITSLKTNPVLAKLPSIRTFSFRRILTMESTDGPNSSLFPKDFFTLQQRRQGALCLHFFGLIYMFIALSVVCDEFFVPSLGAITEKLSISDDVAGATFMAAGGSAPEFFTSLFGVFVTQNNVGIGTIVGSATFNILCVLAFCTLFSREVLKLTWWPMFRDTFFYMLALFLVVLFFLDEKIEWYEAMSLFITYIIYGIAMKYNEQLEKIFKLKLYRITQRLRPSRLDDSSVRELPSTTTLEHRKSIPMLQAGALYRSSVTTLATKVSGSKQNLRTSFSSSNDTISKATVRTVNNVKHSNCQNSTLNNALEDELPGTVTVSKNDVSDGPDKTTRRPTFSKNAEQRVPLEQNIEESEEPIDISWPSSVTAQLSYLFLAPIMLPLYYTLPDAKNPATRKYFVVTFVGSILWIAFFSYLMVWWASVIGETLTVPNEIMGLTVLAAGTSIPDLITSVIVARKGLGDMAVSSSIGSNLFDICIGLPIPWLLQFTIRWLTSAFEISSLGIIPVISKGLICSVGLLFLMLVVLIAAVAFSRWKMDKIFGTVMIIAYTAFCVFSVLLELGYVVCPLIVGCE